MFNLFENAGSVDFFSILARPAKEIYWDSINMLYDEMMSEYERRISRTQARRCITLLLESYKEKNKEWALEPHEIIAAFIDTGWMVQRYDGEEGDDFLILTPFAISFMKSMEDYSNGGSEIQSENYLRRIYFIAEDILKEREDSDAFKYPFRNGVLKIVSLMGDCFYQLSNVSYKTSEDIGDILAIRDLQELINKISDYMDDLSFGYIHDVYNGFDLTEIYRQRVIELIHKIENDEELREKVVWDMNDRQKNAPVQKSEDELHSMLIDMLVLLEYKIEKSYPSYKDRIDRNVKNVIAKCSHKMNLLAGSGGSQLAACNKIIDFMTMISDSEKEELYEQEDIKEQLEKTMNFNKLKILSQESLFKKREVNQKEEMEPVVILECHEEIDLNKLKAEQFDTESANKHAKQFLGSLPEIKASDLYLEEEEDVLSLEEICLMSDAKETEYEIVFLNERVYRCGYEFENFIIRKL